MKILGYDDRLLKLAAVIYGPEDDIDGFLATFATDLIREGHRIGGVVQRNAKGQCGPHDLMQLIDLMTGRAIPICQALGMGAVSCKLDPGGLADAAVCVSRAIAEDVELVVVNKFSTQEAGGGGLRAEIADAVVAGLPILTAVPEKCYDAWIAFTGGYGTTLVCERRIVEDWWREISLRESRARLQAHVERTFGRAEPAPEFTPVPLRLAYDASD